MITITKNSTMMMRRKPTLALTLGIVVLALDHGLVGVGLGLDLGLGRGQEDVGVVGVATGLEGGPGAGPGVGLELWVRPIGQPSSRKNQFQEALSLSLLRLMILLVLGCCCALCTKTTWCLTPAMPAAAVHVWWVQTWPGRWQCMVVYPVPPPSQGPHSV